MITDLLNKITAISDNEEINEENYLESLFYSDNLTKIAEIYKIILKNDDEAEVLPSFKGAETCKKYNIPSTKLENNFQVARFKLHSLDEEHFDFLSATLLEVNLSPTDSFTRKIKWIANNEIEITLLAKERTDDAN